MHSSMPARPEKPQVSRPPSAKTPSYRRAYEALKGQEERPRAQSSVSYCSTSCPFDSLPPLRASPDSTLGLQTDELSSSLRSSPSPPLGSDGPALGDTFNRSIRSFGGAPASPPVSSLNDAAQHRADADIEQWRRAFVEEATNCARMLRRTLDDANITHIAAQFNESRSVELGIAAQMQQHAEELIKQSQAMQRACFDIFSTAEFTRFQSSIIELRQSIDDFRKSGSISGVGGGLDGSAAARKSAAGALGAREAEHSLAASVQRHVQLQQERWTQDDARWAAFSDRLDELQGRLNEMDEVVATRFDLRALGEPEALPQQVARTLASVVRVAVDDINRPMRTMVDSLRQSIADECGALRQHVTSILAVALGDGKSVERPLEPMLAEIGEGVHGLRPFRDQADHWREQSEHWREQAAEGSRAAERAREEREQAHQESSRLGEEMAALQTQINDMHRLLDASCTAPARSALASIKEVEGRGNLRLDIRSGQMELLKSIDFAGRKTSEPPGAEFKSLEVAESVLRDVAEVVTMFNAPFEIEAHTATAKSGSPAYWEEVTNCRAQLVRSQLQSLGVSKATMITKGLPGKKGLNRHCVILRFCDCEVFSAVDLEADKQQGRGKSRDRSPRRARSP